MPSSGPEAGELPSGEGDSTPKPLDVEADDKNEKDHPKMSLKEPTETLVNS
jgi:hypothetical protein